MFICSSTNLTWVILDFHLMFPWLRFWTTNVIFFHLTQDGSCVSLLFGNIILNLSIVFLLGVCYTKAYLLVYVEFIWGSLILILLFVIPLKISSMFFGLVQKLKLFGIGISLFLTNSLLHLILGFMLSWVILCNFKNPYLKCGTSFVLLFYFIYERAKITSFLVERKLMFLSPFLINIPYSMIHGCRLLLKWRKLIWNFSTYETCWTTGPMLPMPWVVSLLISLLNIHRLSNGVFQVDGIDLGVRDLLLASLLHHLFDIGPNHLQTWRESALLLFPPVCSWVRMCNQLFLL